MKQLCLVAVAVLILGLCVSGTEADDLLLDMSMIHEYLLYSPAETIATMGHEPDEFMHLTGARYSFSYVSTYTFGVFKKLEFVWENNLVNEIRMYFHEQPWPHSIDQVLQMEDYSLSYLYMDEYEDAFSDLEQGWIVIDNTPYDTKRCVVDGFLSSAVDHAFAVEFTFAMDHLSPEGVAIVILRAI